jgi:hypothetical protein
MKYENLSKLLKIGSVSSSLSSFDYSHYEVNANFKFNSNFTKSEDVNEIKVQKGCFRTNCIDCLDRTNVVQTLFSRLMAHKMLFDLKQEKEPSGEPFEQFSEIFEDDFKYIWGEHGDHLSMAYSGTNALKGDFTKTGKRTKKGAIMDGVYSCKRFYFNNFRDGYNQDCHDYFLGKINPKKVSFKEHSVIVLKTLIPIILIMIIVCYYSVTSIIFSDLQEPSLKRSSLKLLMFLGISYLMTKYVTENFKSMIISKSTIEY